MADTRTTALSPILLGIVGFSLTVLLAFLLFPARIINDALDCFTLAVSVVMIWVYRRAIIYALRWRAPDRASTMVLGMAVATIAFGPLRFVNDVSTGVIPDSWILYTSSAAATFLIFGGILMISSAGRNNGAVHPASVRAIGVAILLGAALCAFLVPF